MSDKKIVYKVFMYVDANPYIADIEGLHLRNLEDDLKALDVGDKMTIEKIEMTQKELDDMPEFMGP